MGVAQSTYTLDNYRIFLANASFHRLLWRSGLIALVIAILSTILSYPLAYYLASRLGSGALHCSH